MGHDNKNIKLISIDWLQFAVINKKGHLMKKNWIKQDFQTRLFSDIYHYKIDEITYFELVCNPKSHIINKDLCIIKVSNELLYKPLCYEMINYMLEDESFIFNNLTRVDVCCDFAKFDNDIYPDELIYNYFTARWLKNNQAKAKFVVNQTYMTIPEYIRFGDGTSYVSSYLYNKIQEFKDVKHKAYISEMWEKNGLKSNTDIWRLEFSIKEFRKVLTDKNTGQQIVIDLSFLSDNNNLITLYSSLYDKYFDFRINANGLNKSRMKRVSLFMLESFSSCWYSERENLNSDRSDKIMIKKLHNMQNELREIKADYELEVEAIKEYLIRKKNLEEWAKDRHFIRPDDNDLNSEWYKENEKSTINSLYNI